MVGSTITTTPHPTVVRRYTRLYAAFRGLVSHPHPRGALIPNEWRTTRFTDVRAARRFVNDGMRSPNFMAGQAAWGGERGRRGLINATPMV